VIKGQRVFLTAVNKSSIEQLRQWRNDPDLRKYFREHREISQDMQESWFKDRVSNNDKQVDFEIHFSSSGALIGHCGLYYINWINRTAELTIYIGDSTYKGKGLGSDALRLLMDYAFKTINLNRVWCEVFSNNAAVDVYRKIGFKDEGILRQHHYEDGKFLDCYVLGLLRDEWITSQEAKYHESAGVT